MSSCAFRFIALALSPIWKPVQKWPQKGSKRMYPTKKQHTQTHCAAFQKKTLVKPTAHQLRRHFWAKMLQYSTPVSPKYIQLQLFFLQFKYFQIRQLENLRAKRRTPFARNFSHFKKGKKSSKPSILSKYLCTNCHHHLDSCIQISICCSPSQNIKGWAD